LLANHFDNGKRFVRKHIWVFAAIVIDDKISHRLSISHNDISLKTEDTEAAHENNKADQFDLHLAVLVFNVA
jgi:hypothetical protein